MEKKILKGKTNYKVYLVISILVIAGGLVYLEYPTIVSSAEPVLNILTYSSFFDYGSNPNKTLNYIINNFENWYGVRINLEYGTGDLYSQVQQTNGKGYDLVIGLNNLDSYLATESGLFYKFNVSNETFLNHSLYSYLDPSGTIVPYEYSFLTTDFNYAGALNQTVIKNLSFTDLYNSTIGNQYIVENPTSSINGEEFLLGEIAFYQHVLNQSWTSFWNNSKSIEISQGWDSGFNLFENGQRQMFFSYQTDPAYNAYFGYPEIGTTPFHYQNKSYAWLEVLGVGIVNSSSHKVLDQEFVNWLIGKNVEDLVPLNEWTYPASNMATIPSIYNKNPSVTSIVPLNDFLNYSSLPNNIPRWLLVWSQIES